VRELFAAAEERSYGSGDVMIRQGDAAEGLLILVEGTAHAVLRDHTGDHRLGNFSAGDLVGEMALVTRKPRSASVIAESPVRALLVPTAAFDGLATRHLELGMVLTQIVADRLGQGAHDGLGGKRVEEFRILECVGRGGMSVVYRAEDEHSGELVALKMMSYRLIYDTMALARFHQEAELLRSLSHDNIARLRKLFPAYRTYFLVMELCEGVDLQRLVDSRGPLAESWLRPILGQLAVALEYIHSRGLVHRDLKPANVMLTREGRVKLTDFGLAAPAAVTENDDTRAEPRLMGTPAFMAPEQLADAQVDRRTDVYALGCLAYELLTGRRLFVSTKVFELMREKQTMQLPSADAIGASEPLYAFLRSALQVNPDDRPSSLAELAAWAGPCEPPPADLAGGGRA
jgi:serine/threonine protein kinase